MEQWVLQNLDSGSPFRCGWDWIGLYWVVFYVPANTV